MNDTARQKIIKARTTLVLRQSFFGTLALRLALIEDTSCPTAYTNGTVMGYNPDFINSLTQAQITAVVIHEVLHCAMGHPWRKDNREHFRWNIACDFAINPVITDAGYTLPDNCLLDPALHGKSAEWIYDRVQVTQIQQGACMPGESKDPSDGKGNQSGDGNGQQQGQNKPQSASQTESDWKQAVQQAAAAARLQGTLPASLDRFAKDVAQPKVDWRSVLRRFVQEAAKADYTWTKPNRRFVAHNVYMPSLYSERMGPIAVAIDTSGSIDDVTISQFLGEVQGILDECQPVSLRVMACDAAVGFDETYEPSDVIRPTLKGGGGTDFRPVFTAIEPDPPVCLVYLTDLYGSFPDGSEIPTLWVTTTDGVAVPFGETVKIV